MRLPRSRELIPVAFGVGGRLETGQPGDCQDHRGRNRFGGEAGGVLLCSCEV